MEEYAEPARGVINDISGGSHEGPSQNQPGDKGTQPYASGNLVQPAAQVDRDRNGQQKLVRAC